LSLTAAAALLIPALLIALIIRPSKGRDGHQDAHPSATDDQPPDPAATLMTNGSVAV